MTNHDVLDNTVCDIGDCSEKRGCILARARAGVLGPGLGTTGIARGEFEAPPSLC